MADIKSINGNPIVVGTTGVEDGAITKTKLADGVGDSVAEDWADAHLEDWLKDHGEAVNTQTSLAAYDEAMGSIPYNAMAQFYHVFKNCTLVVNTTTDIIDPTAYVDSPTRLSNKLVPLSFETDTTATLSDGYQYKMEELDGYTFDPSRWPSKWSSGTVSFEAGANYFISLRTTQNDQISIHDVLNLRIDSIENAINTRVDNSENILMTYGEFPINAMHPIYKYFKNVTVVTIGSLDDPYTFKAQNTRLTSVEPLSVAKACKVRIFGNNKFKPAPVVDRVITSWPSSWYKEYDLVPGDWIFTIAKDETSEVVPLDTCNSLRIDTRDQMLEYVSKTDLVKDYYADELADTISTVMEKNSEPALVLLLCTDPHYMSVQGTVLKDDSVTDMCVNMRALCEDVQVNALVCLGDAVDAKDPTTTSETIAQIHYVMKQLHSVNLPLMYVLGNHDDNRYVASGSEHFTPAQCYSYMVSYSTDRVSDMTYYGLNYYRDYEGLGIRVLAVDANAYDPSLSSDGNWRYGYSDETVDWVSGILAQTPANYGVVMLSHLSPVNTHNYPSTAYQNLSNMQNEIQTFINNGGNYICTLYGHTHYDMSFTEPWLEIAFGCSKVINYTVAQDAPAGATAPTRTVGTASEDLWDVVIIKPYSRVIDTVRFGAGDNRHFAY